MKGILDVSVTVLLVMGVGAENTFEFATNGDKACDCFIPSTEHAGSEYCGTEGVKKFKLHTHKLNWHQALIRCMCNGMRLATINSQEEHDQLVEQIKALNVTVTGRWWIGGCDLGRRGYYFWYSTAKCFNYTNFYPNQPDNHIYENAEDEHCMELRTEWDYAWNDFVCQYNQYFACEYYCKSE